MLKIAIVTGSTRPGRNNGAVAIGLTTALGVPESGKEFKYHLLGCTDTSQLNPKLLKLLVQNLRDSTGKFENRLLGPSNKIGPTSFRDLTTVPMA